MKMNKRTKVFVFISSVILTGLFLGGYFFVEILDALQIKRKSIDNLLAQNEIYVEKMGERDILSRQYDFVQERGNILEDVFIQKQDLVSTLKKLESLAQQLEVEIELDIEDTTIKKQKLTNAPATGDTGKIEQREKEKKIVFIIEIHGTYQQTMRYLDAIEQMNPIASFESIKMQKEVPEKSENIPASSEETTQEKDVSVGGRVLTNASLSFTESPGTKK